jgi:hypothetical protein
MQPSSTELVHTYEAADLSGCRVGACDMSALDIHGAEAGYQEQGECKRCPSCVQSCGQGLRCVPDEHRDFQLLHKLPTGLTDLNLSFNELEKLGAKLLTDAMKKLRLETLSLDDNALGSEGMHFISQALVSPNNSTLTTLSLAYNFINSDAVVALAEALAVSLSSPTHHEHSFPPTNFFPYINNSWS